MLVANFTTKLPNMGQTKTYEEFSTYLNTKPHRLGVVARMYPENTLNYILDGLRNVFYNDAKGSNRYQPIDSLFFEWSLETNQIKRIAFANAPEQTGEGGTDITMAFTENWYQKYDIFRIDESGQMCIVLSRPIRKRDEKPMIVSLIIRN